MEKNCYKKCVKPHHNIEKLQELCIENCVSKYYEASDLLAKIFSKT